MGNPTFSREDAEKIGRSRGCQDKVMWIGFRSATSTYGEYDDMLALLTPDSYTEFKANTLPSKWENGIAKLMPGDYLYEQGLHGVHHFNEMNATLAANVKDWLNSHVGQDYTPISGVILPYWAYRQAAPATIIRDGAHTTETDVNPADWPFIDLHKGGANTTSSAGCQTFFPDGWNQARLLGYSAMNKYGMKKITYSLHQL